MSVATLTTACVYVCQWLVGWGGVLLPAGKLLDPTVTDQIVPRCWAGHTAEAVGLTDSAIMIDVQGPRSDQDGPSTKYTIHAH